jgi:L-ribulokinase
MWSKQAGFPGADFFAELAPELATIVDDKMDRRVASIGERAGTLSAEAAGWTGLRAGTPVAVANVDAHVSVPAATITTPGTMVAVMGTSTCHLVLGPRPAVVEGMCGVVEDGIVPGLFGFEAGQSAVGDIFGWFVETSVPPGFHAAASATGVDVHSVLEHEAARLRPGASGLVALDWWNGNRSILVDAELSGLIVGLTLATRPPEIYRSLLEATAFGTHLIIEAFEAAGVAVDRIVACGGLPERNRLLMQISADVTGRTVAVAASAQTAALGSAMFGAVAAGAKAGGYDTIGEATARMARLSDVVYRPNPAHRAVYEDLFAEYRELHDAFGRGQHDTMKRLRRIRAGALAGTDASV